MLNVVLVEPEIPVNAGNIARTCAASGARLHMVRPFGFSLDDKSLKRAGLDYWNLLDICYYDSFEEVRARFPDAPFFYATTKGGHIYTDACFPDDSFLVFGKETKGLPEDLLRANRDACVRIPMVEGARSLNLCNSVAIVLYEALRQNRFGNMQLFGKLKGIAF
ncbi:MAG: tRNA (cytidine(34)-2'-O)-methyltransferase [Clostridia bacterium]|nr:tRNA (cytidine(34)-2'-O)-methyltransferase [Clostridia bacterium]